jgi:hyperosmotically inducible protein
MAMKNILTKLTTALAALALAASVVAAAPANAGSQPISARVRKELATLPYYGVFDNLTYTVSEDGTVTLAGQVVRPTTKSDAQARVAHVAGVTRVVNQIEVLPLSSFDDQIRWQAARTIFNTGGLYRYAGGANPAIHIIVNNGRLTLEGVVANDFDRQLARTAALQVPNVFAVTNNLRTDAELRGVR